jgi:hypothetical protein
MAFCCYFLRSKEKTLTSMGVRLLSEVYERSLEIFPKALCYYGVSSAHSCGCSYLKLEIALYIKSKLTLDLMIIRNSVPLCILAIIKFWAFDSEVKI